MNIADAQSAEKVQGALDWMHDLTGYNFLPAGYKRPIRVGCTYGDHDNVLIYLSRTPRAQYLLSMVLDSRLS
jgi:hypothetical protein